MLMLVKLEQKISIPQLPNNIMDISSVDIRKNVKQLIKFKN